jgi:uncharacterized protein with PIN domain
MTRSYDEGLAVFLGQAKGAYEQMFKPERQGDLKTFSQRELCVYEEGRRLSRALLAEHLTRKLHESSLATETERCPHCQRQCLRVDREPEIRPVNTLVGNISFPRAKYRCKHCRKSFFPSGH